ncbi:MAG: PD40 domain-containing protein [Candidatus Coatesbacteria bacterium]|nr:PD40 domain-containing protein [Candidatus Coatesbacteria bacterium]
MSNSRRLRAGFISLTLLLLIFSTAFICSASPSEEPITGASFPALSPDGEKICFSYLGDLWVVSSKGGDASRLTVHEAADIRPRWSPDGKQIAFSSFRNAVADVFVIPSSGGVPRQITFNSSNDLVSNWSADCRWILFDSYRGYDAPISEGSTYKVSIDGGLPLRMMDCTGQLGALSPDGNTLAFKRGRAHWWRKGYRGSVNGDIWVKSMGGPSATRLTDFDGKDTDPMWSPDGEYLYFLSDRDGATNVWRMPSSGGDATQITNLKTDGAADAGMALNGSLIVFCLDWRIYTADPNTGAVAEVPIYAPSDQKVNPIEPRTYTDGADELSLSPDGEQIAFVVRGEIFVMRRTGGEAMRITESPANDREISWSPDGLSLLFCSDRHGTRDIFAVTSSDERYPRLCDSRLRKITLLAGTDAEENAATWSPDGKHIAFFVDRGDLWLMKADGSHKRLLVEGPHNNRIDWSPDSRWISYTRMGFHYITGVWVVSIDGGTPHLITEDASDSYGALWSHSGDRLVYLSSLKARHDHSPQADLMQVFLTKRAHERFLDRRDAYRDDLERGDLLALYGPNKPPRAIEIEFDNIEKRMVRITDITFETRDFSISPDDLTIAINTVSLGRDEVYLVNEFGKSLRGLAAGQTYKVWAPEGDRIYGLTRSGVIKVTEIEDMGTREEELFAKDIPFIAKMEIDHIAERKQMLLEGWRILDKFFYDANFHGADWAAVKDKYLSLLSGISNDYDFVRLLNIMTGELSASHLGAWRRYDGQRRDVGSLGLEFDQSYEGKGLKVSRVIEGGPCSLPGTRIDVGEIVLSIDGTPVNLSVNYHVLLSGRIGKKVDIEVAKTSDAKPRIVTVKPDSYEVDWRRSYEMWAESRKKLADEYSDGRIGYIHIRQMGLGSFLEFIRQLVIEARDKDALVIDVRYNGGGYTHDAVLEAIGRPAYMLFKDRLGDMSAFQPKFAWGKPMTVLINECSGSNAEIFPHSFRQLGLGKLVGKTTGGGVIGTTGIRLLDGTYFRLPIRGCYTLEGKTLENMGIQPDIYVENPPEQDFSTEADDQLKAAVDDLLKQLSARE